MICYDRLFPEAARALMLALANLRDYRQRETEGDAFRRPALYHALTDPVQHHPFIRTDAQGNPVQGRQVAQDASGCSRRSPADRFRGP